MFILPVQASTSVVWRNKWSYYTARRVPVVARLPASHDHHALDSKENLPFWRLVPLFLTRHDDGATSDVTFHVWRHIQQATSHKCNDELYFSLPK